MKDFTEMTADELKNYQGKVFWAVVEYRAPDGKSFLISNFESPTYSHLHDNINLQWDFQIMQSGVSWRWSDGRTEHLAEHLRDKSDAEISRALTFHEPCEGYGAPDNDTAARAAIAKAGR